MAKLTINFIKNDGSQKSALLIFLNGNVNNVQESTMDKIADVLRRNDVEPTNFVGLDESDLKAHNFGTEYAYDNILHEYSTAFGDLKDDRSVLNVISANMLNKREYLSNMAKMIISIPSDVRKKKVSPKFVEICELLNQLSKG